MILTKKNVWDPLLLQSWKKKIHILIHKSSAVLKLCLVIKNELLRQIKYTQRKDNFKLKLDYMSSYIFRLMGLNLRFPEETET